VNYYFKGKEDLYADVLESAYHQAREKYPEEDTPGRSGTAESRLSRFVRVFLLRILDEGRPAWFGKLMAREIVEPTGALDRVIDRAFLPLHRSLGELVREILGGAETKPESGDTSSASSGNVSSTGMPGMSSRGSTRTSGTTRRRSSGRPGTSHRLPFPR
jgi:AcrR family transcriptional regulator